MYQYQRHTNFPAKVYQRHRTNFPAKVYQLSSKIEWISAPSSSRHQQVKIITWCIVHQPLPKLLHRSSEWEVLLGFWVCREDHVEESVRWWYCTKKLVIDTEPMISQTIILPIIYSIICIISYAHDVCMLIGVFSVSKEGSYHNWTIMRIIGHDDGHKEQQNTCYDWLQND